jgi:hypothetical protein
MEGGNRRDQQNDAQPEEYKSSSRPTLFDYTSDRHKLETVNELK